MAVDQTEHTKQDEVKKHQQEWGQQFDIWMIGIAKNIKKDGKERFIEITLSEALNLGTEQIKKNTPIRAIPLRIDKYFYQLRVNGKEVWVNKQFMVSCSLEDDLNESGAKD